ncbi:MAG TPA: serine hydrolase domain-containing protein [Dermatophilaceae bacterium]|nr:MAG: D-alanyl-D-alanine carboxypeptidase precursor [bacterium ADurb.BinA028]HOA58059.1 serine hydrolase domain-containing protein [Dermatophilaceae bacterium]HPK89009.1 serine hydrolase domain-containing protein [Dermatophilaceae bacterium]HPZ68029.1 serine hydrolase domain-containing protein [Dermatophilaceae bacterium]HQD01246.1 serine hydrolase domain-containing protein [Dermatophilaceae bacterium]
MNASTGSELLDAVGTAAHAVHALASGPLGVTIGVTTGAGTRIKSVGAADGNHRALHTDTRFDIASVTKVVATTTAIHRLASVGVLRLDDRVDRFVADSPCTSDATISTLLTHRAGLWEWQPLYLAPSADGRPVDAYQAVAALPLRYPPGERRAYSDLGFILLGRIIERATGLSLAEAVSEFVTGPLGLVDTAYGPVTGDVAASAPGDGVERDMVRSGDPYPVLYPSREIAWRTHELTGEVNDGNCYRVLGGVSGHAGMFSTAVDLLRLGRSLALAATSDDLWRPDITAQIFAEGPDSGQALGWRTMPVLLGGVRRNLLWHPGFTGCALGLVPGTGVALVLLSNRLMSAAPLPTAQLWATALSSLGVSDAPMLIGSRP